MCSSDLTLAATDLGIKIDLSTFSQLKDIGIRPVSTARTTVQKNNGSGIATPFFGVVSFTELMLYICHGLDPSGRIGI